MHRRTNLAVPTLLAGSAFASGLAALVLELQWGRQLALVFGGAHAAVAAVLTAFMLGLGVGSFLGGRIADRVARPALVVAGIELGLVAAGPLLSLALVHLPTAAAALLPGAAGADDPVFSLARLALALALLALPTTLMGATFPIMLRALGSDLPRLHRGIGRIYAANTIGGVVGVLAAGFWVLPEAGIHGSVAVAATSNLIAAGAALAAHRAAGAPADRAITPTAAAPVDTPLLAAAAVSGALVLGAETLWHRALKMVLANSTGTLTLLLALTLAGIGLGAAAVSPLLRRGNHMRWWAAIQLAAAAVLVAQAVLLPEIADAVRALRPDAGWPRVLVPPIAVGGVLILPATLLFGAAWPLLLTAATPRLDDGGRSIGQMGVVNSFGAAAGSAAVGLALLPTLGFGRSALVLAALAAALAALGAATGARRQPRRTRRLAAPAAAAAGSLALAAAVVPSFGRVMLPSFAADDGRPRVLSYRETPSGTVVVIEDRSTDARSMYVDNNAVIGDSYDALKVARMLGLVPTLVHPKPERALVIGFGAGVTTATLAATPGVANVDVVEIVPGVVEAAELFERVNHGIHRDPRVRLHVNDGRNHLLLHTGPWDVITCDPVHPLYGSAPLYSLEFFELTRRRLAPGGIVCQYLPLHRMPSREFRRAIATFEQVFPDCRVLFGLGHAMLLGADDPVALDWARWRDVLGRHPLRNDLASSALHHPAQIAALLQLDGDGCRTIGAGEPSSDLHPHLEFLAPAAYEPGLWRANARLLVEGYTSPIARIANLPPGMDRQLERLVAGKRLLLFSLLERADGNPAAARQWLARARQIAGDDPEIAMYARQLQSETRRR
jgi:spermidine synthase